MSTYVKPGWADELDLRFTAGQGWRIIAPPNFPPKLAAAVGLRKHSAPGGPWQSDLFPLPPDGRKSKVREHAETQLHRTKLRVEAIVQNPVYNIGSKTSRTDSRQPGHPPGGQSTPKSP